jgi:hypothetical protein
MDYEKEQIQKSSKEIKLGAHPARIETSAIVKWVAGFIEPTPSIRFAKVKQANLLGDLMI